mgnify:CR=1 FL=1
MHIVIVAPCLLPQAMTATGATPPQLAMHLAASTPVRHRVEIVDAVSRAFSRTTEADLYVLLWSHPFSPGLLEVAMQLTACEPLVCIWDGPTAAPVDYLLEFCDYVICTIESTAWYQLLATIEATQQEFAYP